MSRSSCDQRLFQAGEKQQIMDMGVSRWQNTQHDWSYISQKKMAKQCSQLTNISERWCGFRPSVTFRQSPAKVKGSEKTGQCSAAQCQETYRPGSARWIQNNSGRTAGFRNNWPQRKWYVGHICADAFNTSSRDVLGFVKRRSEPGSLSQRTLDLVKERKRLKGRKNETVAVSKHHNFLCREIVRISKADAFAKYMSTGWLTEHIKGQYTQQCLKVWGKSPESKLQEFG